MVICYNHSTPKNIYDMVRYLNKITSHRKAIYKTCITLCLGVIPILFAAGIMLLLDVRNTGLFLISAVTLTSWLNCYSDEIRPSFVVILICGLHVVCLLYYGYLIGKGMPWYMVVLFLVGNTICFIAMRYITFYAKKIVSRL